jgi:raffinose/stachyose/melibiose transport system substrate-binding protein
MKKIHLSLLLVFLMLNFVLIGCSSNGTTGNNSETKQSQNEDESDTKKDPVKITYLSSMGTDAVRNTMKDLVAKFEEENPNIKVELNFPSDYANLMKVRMAANDLPDAFDTTGHAKKTYANYLADLSGSSWVSTMTDGAKEVLTDASGKVYALPIGVGQDGITYNADVLKKYNIQPPKTWEEMIEAGEVIKEKSNGEVAPFFLTGGDDWVVGFVPLYLGGQAFVSKENNEAEALQNGTFDWNKWNDVGKWMLQLKRENLLNEDYLTAKYADISKPFAEGKIAFTILPPYFASGAKEINPDLNIGIAPMPGVLPGQSPTFFGGEKYTIGAWKDSEHLEETKKFISFMAKPENMQVIVDKIGVPSGIKGVKLAGEFAPYYEKYKDTTVIQYLDRAYLPDGSYKVLSTSGTELLAEGITPEQFSTEMKRFVESNLK